MKKRTVQNWLLVVVCLLAVSLFAEDSPLYKAAEDGNVAEVKRLLDKGADVNANHLGQTPLHISALLGKTEVVALLLEMGADVHAKSLLGGATPLHNAAYGGNIEVVRLLMEKGADVNAQNGLGHTPLQSAADGRNADEVVKLLQGQGGIRIKSLGDAVLDEEKQRKSRMLQIWQNTYGYMSFDGLLNSYSLTNLKDVLKLSDALLEAEAEKLPNYLLQNPGAEGRLLVSVKKRLRDAQMEITRCKNKAQELKEAGKNDEASKLMDLSVAIQGYQASLMSIKSELENY